MYSCSACTPLGWESAVLAGCVSVCFFVHLLLSCSALTSVCALARSFVALDVTVPSSFSTDNVAFSLKSVMCPA